MDTPTATSPSGGGRPPGPDPAPPPPPASATGLARPSRRVAAIALVMAAVFDLAVHQPAASLAAALLVLVSVAGLVASGRVRNRQALVVGLAAAVVGVFLALRTSGWLVPIDLAATLALVVLTAGFAAGGSVVSMPLTSLVVQGARAVAAFCLAPAYAFGLLAALVPTRSPRRRRQLVAVGRGIGLALPVVVVLAILLASADAVFASIFSLPADVGAVVGYVAYAGIGLVVAAALFVDATLPPIADRAAVATPFGATETTVVLGSMACLYALFAAAQVVALTGGAEHVIETAGLTYADYARGGFFQLLAVAAITLAVLCSLRVATRHESRSQRRVVAVLGEVVVLLSLVIVAVAVRRLGLYEEAFGSTMLRLSSTAFAWWLGVVLALVGVALAGVGASRRWLVAAVLASAVVGLVTWNVVNPEQVVVDRNLARYEATGELDTAYLWNLSDDAVPGLAAALPALDPGTRADVLRRICLVPAPPGSARTRGFIREAGGRDGDLLVGLDGQVVAGPGAPGGPEPAGGLGANRAATSAADTRAEVCR